VVTRNQHIGLKVVNGGLFNVINILPDFTAATIALTSDVTLYLASPAALLLQLDDISGLVIPGLPKGTILIRSKTVAIPNSIRGKGFRARGKLGFGEVTYRTGLLYTPAFTITD